MLISKPTVIFLTVVRCGMLSPRWIQFSLHLMWLSVFTLVASAQVPWNKVINKACRRFYCSEICWPMISLVCSKSCGVLVLFLRDSTVKATLSFMLRLALLVGVLSC